MSLQIATVKREWEKRRWDTSDRHRQRNGHRHTSNNIWFHIQGGPKK